MYFQLIKTEYGKKKKRFKELYRSYFYILVCGIESFVYFMRDWMSHFPNTITPCLKVNLMLKKKIQFRYLIKGFTLPSAGESHHFKYFWDVSFKHISGRGLSVSFSSTLRTCVCHIFSHVDIMIYDEITQSSPCATHSAAGFCLRAQPAGGLSIVRAATWLSRDWEMWARSSHTQLFRHWCLHKKGEATAEAVQMRTCGSCHHSFCPFECFSPACNEPKLQRLKRAYRTRMDRKLPKLQPHTVVVHL